MNRSHIELIQAVVDGEASPQEREQLEALLSSDPEARRLYDELTATSDLLGRMQMVDPPADLKQRIMEAIPAGRHEPGGVPTLIAERLRKLFGFPAPSRGAGGWMGARPVLAVAYVFTMGFIVGVGLISVILPTGDDGTVAGTLAESFSDPVERSFTLDGINGVVQLRTAEDAVRVDLTLKVTEPASVVLTFPASLELSSFVRDEDNPSAFSVVDRAVTLAAASDGQYTLAFRGQGGPLSLEIRRDGSLLFESDLIAP